MRVYREVTLPTKIKGGVSGGQYSGYGTMLYIINDYQVQNKFKRPAVAKLCFRCDTDIHEQYEMEHHN